MRRMRLLHRLRHDVARRHLEEPPVVAGERLLDEHARDRVERLRPLLVLGLVVDPEPVGLDVAGPLACPEVDATTRDEVERRDPFRHAGRVVHGRRELDDPVPEPDARRALRARGEEHLRRARVRVLLEEVVLDLPHVVDAEAVGELDLLEGLDDHLPLRVRGPRPRELELVEQPELHGSRWARPGSRRSTTHRACRDRTGTPSSRRPGRREAVDEAFVEQAGRPRPLRCRAGGRRRSHRRRSPRRRRRGRAGRLRMIQRNSSITASRPS